MNKKFSTLLAAALVAGGLGSSAFAEQYSLNKYVQLQINGKPLVVGESAVRDSLAYVDVAKYRTDLYDYNQTLWQLVAKEQKGANGLSAGWNLYLQNKVNGGVVLTKADADADKTAYYAPGAVVTSGELLLRSNVGRPSENENGEKYVTLDDASVSFTGDVVYEASTKTLKYYYLKEQGQAIKLMVASVKLEGDALKVYLASEADLKKAKALFKAGCEGEETITYGGRDEIVPTEFRKNVQPLVISITKIGGSSSNTFVSNVVALNNIANNAFDLTFTEDISSNAKFANPFTASSLHAVSNEDTYFAASYDTKADKGNGKYSEALKAANDVVADLKQLKTDAANYVKELKVALGEEAESSDALEDAAPNEDDIKAVKPVPETLLASGDALKAFNDGEDALLKISEGIQYTNIGTKENPVYGVKDADDYADDLDAALTKVNTELDKVIKQVEDAVNAYNEAVTNSMTSYKPAVVYSDVAASNNFWVDFSDFAAYDKSKGDDGKANKLLAEAAKLLAAPSGLTGLDATKVKVDWSTKVADDSSVGAYYLLEVVGEADTYITVDTVYAASREKYLTLNTVKFDKVAVWRNSGNGHVANKPIDEDTEFDAAQHKYVLVPSAGHNVIPALFKVDVNPAIVGNDEITIYANAPKALDDEDFKDMGDKAPKYFNQYKDDVAYYDLGIGEETSTGVYENQIKVVIRTLAGAREASVMVPGENEAVLENTTITFAEPVLASKINDGDIYFIINKNVADETNYDKYAVVDPTAPKSVAYAKEAFVNVPATQWYVEKNNDTYKLNNRDFPANYGLGAGKIYVVDEDNMIYTTNTRDTFQLVAADVEKEGHLGYKYISEEIQKISEFALSAVNYANTETPYYLTFNGNEDSILTATSNKEEALALIPMIVDGKQVTEEYEMNDENLTKQYYQLIAKDGKDTLYLKRGDDNMLVVTKEVPEVSEDPFEDGRLFLQFRSINDEPNAYEVLLVQYNGDEYTSGYKLSYNQDGEAVVIDNYTAAAFVYDLVDNSTDIYKNFGFEGSTKVIISLNGDAESKVTKIGPFATVKRTGLDETIDADYSLIMDTAYVDHKDNIRYAYYITKPIVAADTAWNAEKFYMVSYTDSLARENDTIKYSQDNLTRIGFVAAKRVGTDSLAITKAVGATAADTLNVTEALGVTNATFAFAIDENNDEAYRIEVAPAKYVSYLNGILVEGAKEQAQLFNVNATDLTPTDNEEISVEAGVQVIGGKGAVTVQGAAGKTVTVYNFQGRALASTTLTSDNQTIAVPAGLVAVSVEGEPEAISVVVK